MTDTKRNTIQEGDKVILKKQNSYKIISIQRERSEKFENCKFVLDGSIGHAYGTLFLVERGQLKAVRNRAEFEHLEKSKVKEIAEGAATSCTDMKDNRNLRDSSDNQALRATSIMQMKMDGVSGVELLDKLVENSASFASKTSYAQEKYLKKKKEKHLNLFTINKATSRMLCEMYAVRGRTKILGLRIDTLSQLLAYSNVHHGSNVILCETCAGLVLGAILERQGDSGTLVNFFHGTAPPRPETLALPVAMTTRVVSVPLREATALRLTGQFTGHWERTGDDKEEPAVMGAIGDDAVEESGDVESEEGEQSEATKSMEANGDIPKSVKKRPSSGEIKQPMTSKRLRPSTDQEVRRADRLARETAAREVLLTTSWDALVVACKFHPCDLVLTLLHFLPAGRPLVVYSQFLEPLVDLFNKLKQRGGVIQLRITDTWLRNYQVLPERTHAEINMSASSGYLLTGYTLADESGEMAHPATDYTRGLIDSSR